MSSTLYPVVQCIVVGAGPPTRARDPNLRPYEWDKTSYSDLLIFSTTNTWWNHVVTAWCFSAFYVFTCKCIQGALHKKYISGYLFSKKSTSISLALFIAQNHKQIKIIKKIEFLFLMQVPTENLSLRLSELNLPPELLIDISMAKWKQNL